MKFRHKLNRQLRTMVYGPTGSGYMETLDKGMDVLLIRQEGTAMWSAVTLAGQIYVTSDILDPEPIAKAKVAK